MNANPENPDSAGLGAGRSPLAVAVAALVGATSVGFLLLFAAVALFRMRFPFELEWVEGLMLDHVRRVVAGLPIYTPPSLDFVPAVYAPLYYYVAAAACRVLGDGFFPMRLVSFAAALGCFGLIFEIVRRERRGALRGLFAAGLFAATYRACGDYLDLGRVDSLYLFFFLATVALIRFGESAPAGIAAGLLAAAAALTKQTALPAMAPLFCWVVVFRRGRSVPLLASFATASTAAAFLLDRISDGWVWRYCFIYPAQHPLTGHAPWAFWTHFVLGQMPIAALAAAMYFAAGRREMPAATRWFYALLLAGTGGASWLSYTKAGAVDNDFLPAAVALAVVGALGFADAERRFSGTAARRQLATAAVGALILAQFALLRYDPAAHVPSPADAAAGARLLATLRVFPGEIFVTGHGYLGPAIGKQSHSHVISWQDVFYTRDEATKRAFVAEVNGALNRGRFDAIVLDALEFPFLRTILTRYRYMGEFFRADDADSASRRLAWPIFLFVRNDLAPP